MVEVSFSRATSKAGEGVVSNIFGNPGCDQVPSGQDFLIHLQCHNVLGGGFCGLSYVMPVYMFSFYFQISFPFRGVGRDVEG